jgi:diguanylate cyclase
METAHSPGAVPPWRSARVAAGLARLVVVGGTVAASTPWWPAPGRATGLPAAFWVMAVLAVLADLRPDVAPGRRASAVVLPSVCLTFAIVLAWGPVPALAVQAVAVVVGTWHMPQPGRRAAHLAVQYAAGLGAAAVVASAGGLTPWPGPTAQWTDAAVILVAAAAWTAARYGAAAVTARLISVAPRRAGSARDLSLTGATLLLGAVLLAAAQTSPALVPLVLAPLLAVNRLARALTEHRRAARIDPLTGLLNRRALATVAADHGRSGGNGVALLLLDLDGFKDVNDALGHAAGDRLLREVAERLAAALPPHDVIARLGGDEFAVLATRVRDAAAARRLAHHIGAALGPAVLLDGLPVDVSAAVGIALNPQHGTDFAVLLRHAEVAMYEAKQRGDALAVYCPGSDHSPERLALLSDLRGTLRADAEFRADAGLAADTGEITVYYQPQIAVATGEVLGAEALLRWRRPGRGVVDPEELIRVAEHTSVMRQLTDRVLRNVIEQLAHWVATGRAVRIAVNVSVRDLATADIADRIEELLFRHGVPAHLLQLEITEGALMTDTRRVLATINRLDRLGVAISLDDFGTGYSSLQHVRRLPLAEVKVDRSFVLGMATDPDDAAIVRSVIDLAGALGVRVVAEGVEDERTWRALHAAGCHAAQGWFYARPMPAGEFVEWLARYLPVWPGGPGVPAPAQLAAGDPGGRALRGVAAPGPGGGK